MQNRVRTVPCFALILTTLLVGTSAVALSRPPQIKTVAPNEGPLAGATTVTVRGSRFGKKAGAVMLAGVEASIVSWSNRKIVCVSGEASSAGTGSVVVTKKNGESKTLSGGFTYLAPPATAGTLDETIVAGSWHEELSFFDSAALADGSIVMVGRSRASLGSLSNAWVVLHLAPDGSERWSKVLFADPNRGNEAAGVAIDASGRILVTGRYHDGSRFYFRTIRLHASDGSLDDSFEGDGIVDTLVESRGTTYGGLAIAVQSDGRVVVAGTVRADGRYDAATLLLGYEPNGDLDATFGSSGDGYTITGPGLVSGSNHITPMTGAIAIDAADRIVLGGNTGGLHSDWVLMRYGSDGALDLSFGGDGAIDQFFPETNVSGGSNNRLSDIALQPDGRIVSVGNVRFFDEEGVLDLDRNIDLAVTRHNADGTPDVGFANDGRFYSGYSQSGEGMWDGMDWGRGVAIDGSRIVVSGYFWTETDNTLFVLRLDADGSPDAGFGPFGDGRSEDVPIGWDTYGLRLSVDPVDGNYLLPFSVAGDETYTDSDYGRARVLSR